MPAWSQSVETRGGGAWWAHTFRPHPAAEPLTWGRAQEALADGSLGPHLHALLASSPHHAYYWETPPLSRHATDQPFEFVTINAPHLETDADTYSFAEHLCRGPSASSFRNLGGDATLVSPCPAPGVPPAAYAHLGAFVRSTAVPTEQRDAFWREVGRAIGGALRERADAPTWVSTEGSGVAWLHVRLDSRPKYFHHRAYRAPPAVPHAASRHGGAADGI